jgi:hypothetical protein
MSLGGKLTGRVLDDAGKPVAGVNVQTRAVLPTSPQPLPAPILAEFARMTEPVLTLTSVLTDQDGRFELPRLSFGNYALHVEHPDWCKTVVPRLQIVEAIAVDVGELKLIRGAVVAGKVTEGERPVAGAIVNLRSADNTENWETRSTIDGTYSFTQRVPPGAWTILASRPDNGNPFARLIDMRESTRTLTVAAGQRTADEDFAFKAK